MEFQHGCRNWNLRAATNNCGKLFFLKKVNPMRFVCIRAKEIRTFGKVFRQGCELCNFCAQSQFFNIFFVFLANRISVRLNFLKKIFRTFIEFSPTCTEERLGGNKFLMEK